MQNINQPVRQQKKALSFLLFLGFQLIYLSNPAFSQWEQVASTNGISTGPGSFQQLIIENDGDYFVSYYDIAVGKGTVQRFDGASWTYAGGTAGITTGGATYSALATDNAGSVYYSNQDGFPNTGMNVRRFNGTVWGSLTNPVSTAINFQALAVNPAGTLLAAHGTANGTVQRFGNTGNWEQVGTTGFAGGVPNYLDMVTGTNGKVYVAFCNGGFVYVYENDVNAPSTQPWTRVGSGTSVAPATSIEQFRSALAIDASNNLYLAYTSEATSGNKLNVAKFDGNQWQLVGGPNFSPDRVHYVSIAVNEGGTPFVAFSSFENSPNDKNMVMTFNGTNWVSLGGAVSAGAAKCNSLAIDTDGQPVLAYADQLNNRTMVVKFTGCLPGYQFNADDNMITNVQFGNISNASTSTSGASVYESFTGISTNVVLGETYPLTVKGPSNTFPSDVMVYIDWNRDGEFNEAGIYAGQIAPTNSGNAFSVTTSIEIPVTAVTGVTQMRIVKNTNEAALSSPGAPNTILGSCDQTLRAGQTEDYSLNIVAVLTPAVTDFDVVTAGGAAATITTNNGTLQVEAVVLPAEANQDVTWSIVNATGAATISTTGLVTALANGTVWAKAVSVEDAAMKDSLLITITNQVVLPQSIDVVTAGGVSATITTDNGTLQVDADVFPGNANQNVTWSIVNATGTATISTTGLVTAQTNGTVWAKAVSLSNASLKDSLLITITNQVIPVQSIDVTTNGGASATIATDGGTLQLEADVLPANANQNVNWSIVNGTGTATISTTGLVTALTNGTVWAKAISQQNALVKDSLLITITNQTNVGLTENNAFADVSIYPNPASSVVSVVLDKEHPAMDLFITDIRGTVMFRQAIGQNELMTTVKADVSSIAAGVYYLHLVANDSHFTGKIIKE